MVSLMSSAWAGMTQCLGLEHLHVASPCDMGFIIIWQSRGSLTCNMAVSCSKIEGSS